MDNSYDYYRQQIFGNTGRDPEGEWRDPDARREENQVRQQMSHRLEITITPEEVETLKAYKRKHEIPTPATIESLIHHILKNVDL